MRVEHLTFMSFLKKNLHGKEWPAAENSGRVWKVMLLTRSEVCLPKDAAPWRAVL